MFKIVLCIILFVGHVFWAYGIIITKDLKHTNSIQLNCAAGIILTVFSSTFYTINPNLHPIGIRQFVVDLLMIGLLLGVSTYMYILALFMTKNTGNVTIVGFSTVIVGYVISLVRYGEAPNIFGVIGSVCILVGLVCILFKRSGNAKA